jgi:hypothetical protein
LNPDFDFPTLFSDKRKNKKNKGKGEGKKLLEIRGSKIIHSTIEVDVVDIIPFVLESRKRSNLTLLNAPVAAAWSGRNRQTVYRHLC